MHADGAGALDHRNQTSIERRRSHMLWRAGWVGGLILTLLFMTLNTALAQQRRTALVIGNAAYETGPLRNPANDATDMAALLQRLGFEVTLLKDAKLRTMEEAIEAFSVKLRRSG